MLLHLHETHQVLIFFQDMVFHWFHFLSQCNIFLEESYDNLVMRTLMQMQMDLLPSVTAPLPETRLAVSSSDLSCCCILAYVHATLLFSNMKSISAIHNYPKVKGVLTRFNRVSTSDRHQHYLSTSCFAVLNSCMWCYRSWKSRISLNIRQLKRRSDLTRLFLMASVSYILTSFWSLVIWNTYAGYHTKGR